MSETEKFAMAKMNAKPFQACARMDSCFGDPNVELGEALDENNLRLFVDILCMDGLEVNKEMDDREFATILHLAVSRGKAEFVRELAKLPSCNPNIPHRTSKMYPIHVAADKGYVRPDNLIQDKTIYFHLIYRFTSWRRL